MKGKLKIIIFSLIILLLIAGAIFLYLTKKILEQPNLDIKENTIIKIEENTSTKVISETLYNKKLIKNKIVYAYATKLFGKVITPGFYEIPSGSSMADVINLIDSGKIKLIKITIPEGWRMEQIAKKLDQEKILSYDDFVREALGYEGKIFPDTYYLNPQMQAKEVLTVMNDNFKTRTAGLEIGEDDLILASIVEREASKDSERAVIAGVYKNRLKSKIKLEADPTVQYARDTNQLDSIDNLADYKFWQPVGFSDYKNVKSDFNTYLINGLPPKPICNPGLKSIEAALNPQGHNYLFFLQYDGNIYLSKTIAEHDAYRRTILGQK